MTNTPPNAPAAEREGEDWLGMTPVLRAGEDELARLCAGRGHMTARGLAGRGWTMCVPVRRDDSDVIFSDVLIECRTAHERIAELESALLAARATQVALRALLERATTRLEILQGRMAACDDASVMAGRDDLHRLSLFEIPGWVEEQRAALAATPVDATACYAGGENQC